MKKIIGLICISIGCLPATFAQDKTLSIGLELTPAYTDWRIQNVAGYADFIVFLEEQEQGNFGGTIGLFASAKLSEKFESSVGINYQRGGIRTKKFTDFYTGNGTPDPALPDATWSVVQMHSVALPIKFKYNILPFFYVRAGVSTSYLVAMPTIFYAEFGDEVTSTKSEDFSENFRRINLSTNAGLGYQVMFNEKTRGFFEPCINISLLGISKEAVINRYPFYLGATFGVQLY
jgi:hypothetical protein